MHLLQCNHHVSVLPWPQVERALAKIGEVRTSMVVLMVVEGCLLFTVATVYVCLLVHRVRRRLVCRGRGSELNTHLQCVWPLDGLNWAECSWMHLKL